uniref:Glycine N-acyltransferase-like protein n=1 Tax=Naja naja TaxID=35670 RepID=A0A8C6Y0J7_NAJNA
MLILTCSSKLQLLESVLRKGLPETLLVCGAVMHINRGNPAQHEVVVDSWPEFKAVLTRPRKEVVKDKRDCYANLHAAFYREEDACRTLLENKDAVDWDKLIFQTWWDALLLFHHHYHLLFPFRLRSNPFHLGTLNPSHAALLNDTYEFGGNDRSLHYLRSLIEDFPNACLLGHKGQLLAWSLSDALGCLTHGYALPEYRGKGHMKTVLQALARKLHAKDFALYTRVRAENKISNTLALNHLFILKRALPPHHCLWSCDHLHFCQIQKAEN